MHLRKAIILSFATLLIPTILVSCSKQEKSNSTKKTSKSPAAQEKPLICHIGGTMRPVVAKLAKLYEKKTGQRIEINAAGSGELLAYIENQQHGDLYVCHDPFLDILMKKFHMGVDGWLMAELTPVIVVQKGNPKNIKGIMDFTRDDLEIWLTDYKKSSLGRMMPTIFKKVGIDFKELNRKKRINIHKKGGYVANMVKTNNGDVGICWNAIAKLREETLDIIEIPQNQLPTPQIDAVSSATGKSFFLTPMRVTIATLKCSTNPEASKRFAEFLTSPEGSNCFCEFGFTMIKTIKLYENGKAL